MRKKYPNLVGLLMVLAMVCSLVAVVAAPAAAVTAGFTVTLTPNANANAGSNYAIGNFTTSVAMAASDSIYITFPTGTVMPTTATIAKAYVTWTGADGTNCAWATTDTDPVVSGQQIIIKLPALATGGQLAAGQHKVVISASAGIKNPLLSKATTDAEPYKIAVTTSASGETSALSAPYAIDDYVTFTPASGAYGSSVTVIGGGFYPGSSITITDGAMGAGDVGSTGTFTATCAAIAAAQVVATDGTGRTATSVATFNLLPTLTVVLPTSGNVGATVYLQGRHFTTGGNITALASATFGGTAMADLLTTGTGGSQINVVFTDLDADSSADDFNAYFTVPACASAGSTEIKITDSGSKIGTASFVVNARTVAVGPTNGAPGITATVTGSGFAASATGGAISFGQVGLTSYTVTGIPTDGNGAFERVVTIPAAAIAGNLPITFSIAGCTKTATFVVTGNVLSLSSSSGPKGSYVTIWGSGFSAGTTYYITSLKIGTVSLAYTGAIPIDTAGNMQATTCMIPNTAAWGAQTITATDTGSVPKTGTAAYTVQQPTIAISLSEGYMGDTVTVTGQGWIPGIRGLVGISITDSGTTTLAVVSTPGDDGSFTGAVPIPVTGIVGPRTITISAADGVGNTAASKFFTVKSASISVSPQSQAATKTVTVTGLGFTPQSPVTAVTIAGATVNITPGLVVTDALGKFTCTFVVPGLVGVKTISASVLGDTRTTFLTITAAPASVEVQTANISSQLVRIWGYSDGTWHMYDPATPALNDLPILGSTNGYWFKVTETCTLVYGGFSKVLSGSDWTLVGWP